MPTIDDVNYLYEHSVNDSYMFFIDSGNRDRTFYPDPNEYVVTFEEPLRLVVGMEILDGAVPNTMYNIDAHNNLLTVTLLGSSEDESGDFAGFNARLPALLQEQQGNAAFAELLNAKGRSFDAVLLDRAQWEAHPELAEYMASELTQEQAAELSAQAPNPSLFVVISRFSDVPLIRLSSVPEGGRAAFVDRPEVMTFTALGERYVIPAAHPAVPALMAAPDAVFASLDARTGTWSLVVSANVPAPRTHGGVQVTLSKARPPALRHDIVTHRTLEMEVGDYDVNSMQVEIQERLFDVQMYALSTDRNESTDLIKQRRIMFTSNSRPFVLNMDVSTIYQNVGFDAYARPDRGGTDYAHVHFNDNNRLFGSLWNPVARRFQLRSPGAVSLLGARYVRLRCKEIEDHLSSSATFMSTSTGVGIFKLQDIKDVTQVRFDFATFLRKPFHPIGKLTRLTFRFETPSGIKYDFKGFNHQLLVSVKYLAPNMGRAFKQSSLNPNYDPDYVRYVTNLAQFAEADRFAALQEEESEECDSDSEPETESDPDEASGVGHDDSE